MTDPTDWLRQFGAMQSFWNNLPHPGFGFSQPPQAAPAWPQGWDFWRQFAPQAPAAPAAGNEFAQGLLAQSKRYLEFLQGLGLGAMPGMDGSAGAGAGLGEAFDPRAWLDQLRNLHETYGQRLAGSSMPWFGGVDTSHIEQIVRSFMAAPGNDLRSELSSWLNLPTFGLNREQQSRGQGVVRAWLDYQVANARYNELMLTVASRTFEILGTRLDDARTESEKRITTARGLYDACIDAAEEAFAGIAMSAEYAQINGELINAQNRVRAAINDEVGRMAAQFGLPTRQEVDSIARQVHDLKRKLAAAAPAARGSRVPAAESASAPASTAARTSPPAPAKATKASTKKASAKRGKKSDSGKDKATGKRVRSAAARVAAPASTTAAAKPAKRKAGSGSSLQLRSTTQKRG